MKPHNHLWLYIQNRRAYMVHVVIVILLLTGCVADVGKHTIDTGKHTMSSFTLSEEDKGKTITIHPGDQVVVSLKENPTTGFQWTIDKIDNALLVLDQSSYSQPSGGGIGGGGKRVMIFAAKGPGTAHLQLKLWRAWEGDTSIINRFDATIQIQS